MKFSGDFNGHSSFLKVEGTCPNDVIVLIDPELKHCKLRCWVLIHGHKGGSCWTEVFLDIPNFFQSIQQFVEDKEDIQVRFRSPLLATIPNLEVVDLHENMTDLTLEESISSESSGDFLPLESLQFGDTPANLIDPLSGKDISTLQDSFSVIFYSKKLQSTGSKTLCVSQSCLEAFVAQALNEGRNIFRLNIARDMECVDNRRRSFSLTPRVWVESLIPYSRVLRVLFYKASETSLQRKFQLLSLENDRYMWQRVHFWLSDVLSTRDSSRRRLEYQPRSNCDDGELPLLSRFYFTIAEGENLGRLLMPNGTVLCNLIGNSAARVVDEEHSRRRNLGLELCQGLNIELWFLHDESFMRRKKQWIRDREDELTQSDFLESHLGLSV